MQDYTVHEVIIIIWFLPLVIIKRVFDLLTDWLSSVIWIIFKVSLFLVNVSGSIVIFLFQLFGELNCLCGCTFFELNLSFDCVNVNVTCQVSCLFLNENFLFIFLLAFYYLWSINYHVWNAMRGSFSWVGAAEHYVYAGIFSRCCYIFWCWHCVVE
jgi:hypothetical protein